MRISRVTAWEYPLLSSSTGLANRAHQVGQVWLALENPRWPLQVFFFHMCLVPRMRFITFSSSWGTSPNCCGQAKITEQPHHDICQLPQSSSVHSNRTHGLPNLILIHKKCIFLTSPSSLVSGSWHSRGGGEAEAKKAFDISTSLLTLII